MLAENVGTICLPPLPYEDFSNFDVTGCVVTGWGERAEDPRGSPGQAIMKAVHGIPIVEHSECENKLKTINGRFRLHESFICAGGERGIDACQGDGGGPLACPIPNPDADPALDDRYVHLVESIDLPMVCHFCSPCFFITAISLLDIVWLES